MYSSFPSCRLVSFRFSRSKNSARSRPSMTLSSRTSNPSSAMSTAVTFISSRPRRSMSHSAISPTLLSARRNARTCSGVRSSAMMTGTCFMPSFFAAFSLVWPVTTVPSLSMTSGTFHPNSRMLAATASTALSFFLGFLSYGRIWSTLTHKTASFSTFSPRFVNNLVELEMPTLATRPAAPPGLSGGRGSSSPHV